MTDEKAQKKYFEFQMVMQQLQQLEGQMNQVKQNVIELTGLASNLKEMKSVSSGKDMYVPMGSGIFVKAKTLDSSSVVMNVGASTCVTKSVDDAVAMVEKQVEELKGVVTHLEGQMEQGVKTLQEMQKEMG
tara:strand:- start:328 stop:720 length:393 start_codon:yes stop_codon:yes gene_type:complete